MILRLFALLHLTLLLIGCTTIGMDPYLEKDPERLAQAKAIANQPNRATLYFYRRYPLGTPNPGLLPPYYFAVDDRVVSAMAVGMYVVLSLPPGRHKLTRLYEINGWRGIGFDRYDLDVDLQEGRAYYVGASNGLSFSRPLASDDAAAGENFLKNALLANFFHADQPIDTFINQSIDARKAKADRTPSSHSAVQTSRTSFATSISDWLPSSEQVSNALETLAIVGFVSLMFVSGAAVVAAAGNTAPYFLPNEPPPSPRKVIAHTSQSTARLHQQHSTASALPVDGEWSTRSGVTTQVSSSSNEFSVFNASNGVRYRYENGRIYGSDGSGYRMYGSTMISNTGRSYQIIGNQIFSADGRNCVKTGNNVSCN